MTGTPAPGTPASTGAGNPRAPGEAPQPSAGWASPGSSAGAWWVVLVASGVGLLLTTLLAVEEVALIEDPEAVRLWDLSSRVSCSPVLGAWQSSIFGPPNGLIGAVVFAILGSSAVDTLFGGHHGRSFLAALWGMAFTFALFATWFAFQIAFVIDSLCLWCAGIATTVLATCAALTRIVTWAQVWGSGQVQASLDRAIASHVDLIVWTGWWLGIGAVFAIGLA